MDAFSTGLIDVYMFESHITTAHKNFFWCDVLSGSIPQELGNLTSLDELDLNRNRLSGESHRGRLSYHGRVDNFTRLRSGVS